MKKHSSLKSLFFLLLIAAFPSCASDDSENYTEVPNPTSPVVVDLATVPYQKLSEYKFFHGEMKNLEPAYKVIPYDLNSALFTDYAHKKRFVWMPDGTHASYTADNKVLDFPTGAVLIKNFYYENVLPHNSTRIIETRLMIKKATGWIFANYIWNDEQTEAFLDMNGAFVDINWNENGVDKSTSYRIPSRTECYTCHKSDNDSIPIGPKPQNLNKMYTYTEGAKNQLAKWAETGYLDNSLPSEITSTIDWTDTSKPLELRVRSYLDANCAHCHHEGSHCDYRPIRLAFSETGNPENLGICVEPQENINVSLTHIVARGNATRSVMHYRLNTNVESERMPLLGRTIKHEEAVAMIKEWINSMENPCP